MEPAHRITTPASPSRPQAGSDAAGAARIRLKILHLIDSEGLYGAENVLLNLAEQHLLRGCDVTILSAGTPDTEEKALEREATLRGIPVLPWRMRAGFNLHHGLKILRYARTQGYDILHCHGYKFNILLGSMPKAIRRLPLITTMHGYVTEGSSKRMRIYLTIDRHLLPRLDKVVFVNAAMRSQPFFRDLKLPNATVIDNGIPFQRERQKIVLASRHVPKDRRLREVLEQQGPIVGAVGRLSEEKGFLDLIYAFRAVREERPNAQLVIIGEGPQREVLLKTIRSLELDNAILLPGFLSPIYYYLSRMQAFVVSSHTEGLPMTVLEAMLARTPIVATRVGGIPHVLDHGHGGILVDPKDRRQLADGILLALGDKRMTDALTAHAHERVTNRYDASTMANAYLQTYREVTGRHQPLPRTPH